jgi:hypothetical protein
VSDLDLEARRLCADGACIGVLDDDGRCKVCGKIGDGPAPARASTAPMPQAPAAADHAPAHGGDDDDLTRRELCPDGACIGVLGDDGKCKVCGKTADAG